MRGIVLLCLALIGGPILIVTGIGEYRNSKKLIADGKATTGSLLKWEDVRSRKGRHTYYLTISFKPEAGQELTQRTSVGSDVFSKAVAEQTVKVHYLPSDPSIFQLGETAHTQTSAITTGSLLLLGAIAVLGYKWVSRSSKNECADTASTNPPGQDELQPERPARKAA